MIYAVIFYFFLFSFDNQFYTVKYRLKMENKINKDCEFHRRNCDMFCTYSKCQIKIICTKCVNDHLKIHPKHFIYDIENLLDVHSFDKVGKLKQMLGRQKIASQQKIKAMYQAYTPILNPLTYKVKQFEIQSKQLIQKQFLKFLANNKSLIESCKIQKTDPTKAKVSPEVLIDETITEVNLVNDKQDEIKQKTQKFLLYREATAEMNASAQKQITKMSQILIKLLDYYLKIQTNMFRQGGDIAKKDQEYQPFYLKYVNLHKVASRAQGNSLQLALIQSKKLMDQKNQQLLIAKQTINDHLTKIEQQSNRIQSLKQEISELKSKQERDQRQRKQAQSVARQKIQEYLIKNQIVMNQSKGLSFQKKALDNKYLDIAIDMVKNPIQLILTQHNLTKQQLGKLLGDNQAKNSSLQQLKILRMSFMPLDKEFICQALNFYQNIHTLQLNTCNIQDLLLQQISAYFPPKLKHLHLIDNQLSDDGLQRMFINLNKRNLKLQSLYVSYNNLTHKAIDLINFYNWQIRVLHISKNLIKNKGVNSIGRTLKCIQQLFIGGTGVTKQGILNICRNCSRLKRLSLVANEMSTDIVSQILLGLHKLQWLDISYSTVTASDIKKIDKLRQYNKNMEIVLET